MSQQDIIKALERRRKGLTTRELSMRIGTSKMSINRNLRSLRKFGEVKMIRLPKEEVRKIYRNVKMTKEVFRYVLTR